LGSGRAGNGSGAHRHGTEKKAWRGRVLFFSAQGAALVPEETTQRRALPCLQTTVWRGWSLQLLLGSPPWMVEEAVAVPVPCVASWVRHAPFDHITAVPGDFWRPFSGFCGTRAPWGEPAGTAVCRFGSCARDTATTAEDSCAGFGTRERGVGLAWRASSGASGGT
jgi:hypothetical protein